MSNRPVRVTFNDGTELFTMGDGVIVLTQRLWHTEDEAHNAYREMIKIRKENNIKPYLDHPFLREYFVFTFYLQSDELKKFEEDTEIVNIEYKLANSEWAEMTKPFCRASKRGMIILEGPSYFAGDYA